MIMAKKFESDTHNSRRTEIQNILMAINVRWWNAEAAYAINSARGLIEMGCNVWLVVNPNSPVHRKAVQFGIPVLTDLDLDSISLFVQLSNFRKLLKYIEQNRIQVVNTFKSNGSFLFSLLRKRFPGLVYIKTRGEARAPKNHFVNRYLYGPKACDGIVVVGKTVKQWMYGLAPKNNIRTIYYGDSAVEYEKCVPNEAVRKQYAIPTEATVLSLIGRKVHLLFLVKDLKEYPEELAKFKSYIRNNGLQDQVTILGFQKQLGNLMRIVDIGVVPSIISEVNCRVAVEYMSLGIPVVAFPTGSLPEIVKHGETGLICREKTARNLQENLEKMIGCNYIAMGKSGYKMFRERYDLPIFSNRLYDFYKQCQRVK